MVASTSNENDCAPTCKIANVHKWFARMNTCTSRALTLSKHLSQETLDESDEMFWALIKHAENTQECITQVDNMGLSVLESLEEIPIDSEHKNDFTWKHLRGMRNKLVHNFWEIDKRILWNTITNEFPDLITLFSRLIICPAIINPESPEYGVTKHHLKELPVSAPGDEFTLGNSLILLSFDKDLNPLCFRISKQNETHFWVNPPGNFEGDLISMHVSNGEDRKYVGRRL